MAKKPKKAAKELKRRVQGLAGASTELTHAAHDKAEVALRRAERLVKDNRWPAAAIGVVVGVAVVAILAGRLVLGAGQTLD